MNSKIAIIYYSSTGTTYKLARAIEKGAKEAGAEVRLLKVKELAPREAINSNKAWAEHLKETQNIPEATLDDLEWADGVIFGSPTRYGLPSAQIKQFIDQTGSLWAEGKLANKIGSSFTSASTAHGGHETTIIALNNTFYHWGSIIVGLGYVEPSQFEAGNPYGASFISDNGKLDPDKTALEAAKLQGKRVAEITAAFVESFFSMEV